MAFTQNRADTEGIVFHVTKDDDGFKYITIGGLRKYVGTGDPNGEVTAPKGSTCIDKATGKFYSNVDGGTTWTAHF